MNRILKYLELIGIKKSKDLFIVMINKNQGLIHRSGKHIFPPKPDQSFLGLFDEEPYDDWPSRVYFGLKAGFIDKNGRMIIKSEFDSADPFYKGLAIVEINNKYGFIDQKGNIIIDTKYAWISEFSEGLAAVRINDKCGYIDNKDTFIIKPKYNYAYKFINGVAQVGIENQDKYINKQGELVSCRVVFKYWFKK